MQPVRITILGSGTSSGVPVIGCDCAVCTSVDPRDRRLRTSALIETIDRAGQPRAILIDASPDLREQAIRAGMRRCDAILFTHYHVDHIFGLDEVRRFNVLMGAPIDVYAEPETMGHLRRIFRYIFEPDQSPQKSFIASLIPHALEPGVAIELYGLRIEPIRLLHGHLPILGFRVERAGAPEREGEGDDPLPLAYCTDVSSIPPETWPRLTGLRTLILDALRYRSHPTHFTVDRAIETAAQTGAAAVWFIHMTHDVQHADLDPRLPEGMHLAYDGLTLGRLPAG